MADLLRRRARAWARLLIGDIPTLPGYYSHLDNLDGLEALHPAER
ncbi:hypothetical protein [Arthrobacter sp. N1]